MTAIQVKLQAAATTNNSLLATLSATDYAAPALAQQTAYISDLTAALKKADKDIAALGAARKKELKDHEKYRDSVMRRFAYKVSRKEAAFAEKAAVEEREYFEALQKEHRANEERRALLASLDEAQIARTRLVDTAGEHDAAQKELDALYDGIFAGATPAFPAEDEAEEIVRRAQVKYGEAGAQKERAHQVLDLMQEAGMNMARAKQSIERALSCSRMDMFGGGAMADMMERSALGEAETQMQSVHRLVAQACRMAPQTVKPLPVTDIAQGNLMSDVFFDNIFTDMAFHDKIKQSQVGLQTTSRVLDQQIQAARLSLRDFQDAEGVASAELASARDALQKQRQKAFESVNA